MRRCTKDGCSFTLRADNTSGYCRHHYHLSDKAKDGYARWLESSPDLKRERDKAYYELNRDRKREVFREYRARHQDAIYFQKIKRYGINADTYLGMMKAQEGLCLLCFKAPEGKRPRLVVDHCHATGVVRGLLCTRCNNGLGQFKDRPEVLLRAADYLQKNFKKDSGNGNEDSG